MIFRKLQLVAALTLALAAFASLAGAQDSDETVLIPEDQNQIESTTRINEFGRVSQTERLKRLDVFLIELQNNPGARGYIVFYQGNDALPSQFDLKGEDLYRDHLRGKNFDEGRISFLNAFRAQQTTEFWIVPGGENAPQLTNTISALTPRTLVTNGGKGPEAFLYHRSQFEIAADDFMLRTAIEQRESARDEFLRDNGDSLTTEDENPGAGSEYVPVSDNVRGFQNSWSSFNSKLKDNAGARGLVIFYADEKVLDVEKLRMDMSNRLRGHAAEAQIPVENFNLVYGGYRSGFEIEMWVVPHTAKTPEARPGKRSSVIE